MRVNKSFHKSRHTGLSWSRHKVACKPSPSPPHLRPGLRAPILSHSLLSCRSNTWPLYMAHSHSGMESCNPRPHYTASNGRTPKCRATQHLQAGACCLPQKRLTSVNANKPRRLLGKLALALPQHGLGKPKPLLLLGAPRTETGNPPGTCKSTFHAWGVSKGHTGCQGLPWSLWPSIMCFDNCRQACSFRHSIQGTSQTKMLSN